MSERVEAGSDPVVGEVDVIAALRIADEATDDYAVFGQVAHRLLGCAPGTPGENTGGLELLLRLQRDGALAFRGSGS